MNAELATIFTRASQLAARGEYEKSAAEYASFLQRVAHSSKDGDPEAVDQAIRSGSFNYAQVCNHLGRFTEALEHVSNGLSRSPSQVGRAIGLAAKGEALYGLSKFDEGKRAFEFAVQAHAIIGRLNVADSMTRISTVDMQEAASRLLLDVENTLITGASQASLQQNASKIAELYTIRGKLCVRHGRSLEGKKWFEKALQVDSSYDDARLQIRNLSGER